MLPAVQNQYEATRSWFLKATRFHFPSILIVPQTLGIAISLRCPASAPVRQIGAIEIRAAKRDVRPGRQGHPSGDAQALFG